MGERPQSRLLPHILLPKIKLFIPALYLPHVVAEEEATWVRTKKQHKCAVCGRGIQRGEMCYAWVAPVRRAGGWWAMARVIRYCHERCYR